MKFDLLFDILHNEECGLLTRKRIYSIYQSYMEYVIIKVIINS